MRQRQRTLQRLDLSLILSAEQREIGNLSYRDLKRALPIVKYQSKSRRKTYE
jgi:hypothetical protein